jgi:hypothetical protein
MCARAARKTCQEFSIHLDGTCAKEKKNTQPHLSAVPTFRVPESFATPKPHSTIHLRNDHREVS